MISEPVAANANLPAQDLIAAHRRQARESRTSALRGLISGKTNRLSPAQSSIAVPQRFIRLIAYLSITARSAV